jgi:hypothetical protein
MEEHFASSNNSQPLPGPSSSAFTLFGGLKLQDYLQGKFAAA